MTARNHPDRVGIVGGGQLCRMLVLAGKRLGLNFLVYHPPGAGEAVGELAPTVEGTWEDAVALHYFASQCRVVTYEMEQCDGKAVSALETVVPLYPPPMALRVAQNRAREKSFLQDLGIPTAPFCSVRSRSELERALVRLGYPAVLKLSLGGYDGRGQAWIHGEADIGAAWEEVGAYGACILEQRVGFSRELSLIAVRNHEASFRTYALSENKHRDGILRSSLAPAPQIGARQEEAAVLGHRIAAALNYVGTLAVEFFDTDEGLVVNEIAPRVHNSGHWTQDGAVCDQFENHLRAVCGLPLGSTRAVQTVRMDNVLGSLDGLDEAWSDPLARVHLYGKSPRPGRKLGHINRIVLEEDSSSNKR